ncbi:DUF2756 family protein [Salmonella enterica]|uniref:DUF2756 family protein n=2 Tax=Salmonella enterica TaxID=28901 RepID=A0A5U2TSK0_SALER|nr:DUF2756 family protein [Salmonella enterica]ECJ5921220.1 DUF2756 family protein [Salmonella enterica subsp. houtenae]EDX4411619.1 DUF2756 family protein [Salmonella enterica subsp. houtenae serovar 44:z36,[z38]:-]HAC6492105.1 DUF2756 family protein [Salmonella enterica subsp. houtenae serovar 44:z36[z38]:-]EAS2168750.1 DUF2756 family protein [Salmonella enterica]
MKRLLLTTALLPFTAFTQPLNTMNNPNMQGYQIPSQQRMQTQMQTQQIQQQGMLKQQVQTQARSQQQNLQSQLNANTQRVQQGQPGNGMLGQQTLPNTQGGMLSGTGNPDRMLNHSQPVSPQGSGTPQPDIPLKTISP